MAPQIFFKMSRDLWLLPFDGRNSRRDAISIIGKRRRLFLFRCYTARQNVSFFRKKNRHRKKPSCFHAIFLIMIPYPFDAAAVSDPPPDWLLVSPISLFITKRPCRRSFWHLSSSPSSFSFLPLWTAPSPLSRATLLPLGNNKKKLLKEALHTLYKTPFSQFNGGDVRRKEFWALKYNKNLKEGWRNLIIAFLPSP